MTKTLTPTPKEQRHLFKCPECEAEGVTTEYRANSALGIHRRAAHGILGKSHTATKARKAKEQQPKRGRPLGSKTKRSELATVTTTATPTHSHAEQNGHPLGYALDTTAAIAFGRFEELCAGLSREFDVPPRSLATRCALLIGQAYPQIRSSSRSPYRMS